MIRYDKHTEKNSITDLSKTPIQCIGAKAFLSCKEVEKLILPDALEQIEDWAFAHMKNLAEIELPAKELLWGKQVFLGCEKLEKVTLSGIPMLPGLPFFVASVFCHFTDCPPDFLASLKDISGQKTWLVSYDRMLLDYLTFSDDKGFVPAFIGWFDVEDVDDQKDDFIKSRRLQKLLLTLNRLEYPDALTINMKTTLEAYLITQNDNILEMIKSGTFPRQNQISFYRIWHAAGGLGKDTASQLLTFDTIADPEIRSFLIGLQLNSQGEGSFFDNLDL